MSSDDIRVGPRLAPPRPAGFKAPSTGGLNPSPPTLDTSTLAKPRQARNNSPYALRNEDNDFLGHEQDNMRLVAWREAYQVVTAPGALDITAASYFIIRSVGASDFAISLPTPIAQNDPVTGDRILEAWAITIDIEYTGTGKPSFGGVAFPDDTEPEWSSEAGKLDTVVLTWAERWLLRTSSLGYQL